MFLDDRNQSWLANLIGCRTTVVLGVLSALLLLVQIPTHAADPAYYVLPVQHLQWKDGRLPDADELSTSSRYWQRRELLTPYGAFQGDEGEIYFSHSRMPSYRDLATSEVAIRARDDGSVWGWVFWPKPDYSGMVKLEFTLDPERTGGGSKQRFLEVKQQHYQRLQGRDIAGAAWFRHQVQQVSAILGQPDVETRDRTRRFFGTRRTNDLEDTLALVSGGRALSENLQLDRVLPTTEAGLETVEVDSIEGITIRELDWEPLLPENPPTSDPLAGYIPDDQHAVFLPSFDALITLVDQAHSLGTPVLRAAEGRAEDASSLQLYQRQLGLPLDQVARALGPRLINSVAITGGDAYFRTGTDVAVLFEAKQPEILRQLIASQVAERAQQTEEAEKVEGKLLGVPYTGWRSTDRVMSSYIATLDDVVVVTNSPAQLERLFEVHQGERSSLGHLDEYGFFRDRYPYGDEGETALLLLSDKTIRRWCGPRWRIASSRRTRAAAVLSEIQASHLDRLVANEVEPGPVHTQYAVPDGRRFALNASGVSSEYYGSLEFQSPIIEMELNEVTKAEADLYGRWKRGYERNWSNFFDPIAMRVQVDAELVATDLTVMPLIANSDYRTLIDLSQGTELEPDDGDPHDSLLHAILSLDPESTLLQQANSFARGATELRFQPFSWVGDWISVYVDNDLLWKQAAESEDPEAFFEENSTRSPLGVHVDVRDGFKLTAFLAALRAFIEQTAPGMTLWETVEYGDDAYVKLSPSPRGRGGNPRLQDAALYYYSSGRALILSLNEGVLKRAIDRQVAGQQPDEGSDSEQTNPWIGGNLGFQLSGPAVPLLARLSHRVYQQLMQRRAWSNIPILNEWRHRYPKQDPVELHQRFWQRQLVGPDGGGYRWNEQWHTMESTVYGHPGQPELGPAIPKPLQDFRFGNFGLTFEPQGLRARVELEMTAKE